MRWAKNLWAQILHSVVGDKGSVAPLGLGLALLSLVATLTFSAAGSLYIFQNRLATMAEEAAVFEGSLAGDANDYLAIEGSELSQQIYVAKDENLDGVTTEVKFCAIWRWPLAFIDFLDDQTVCGYGAAR
jgi:hypothetical protein